MFHGLKCSECVSGQEKMKARASALRSMVFVPGCLVSGAISEAGSASSSLGSQVILGLSAICHAALVMAACISAPKGLHRALCTGFTNPY